jgi:hypothetical protein
MISKPLEAICANSGSGPAFSIREAAQQAPT